MTPLPLIPCFNCDATSPSPEAEGWSLIPDFRYGVTDIFCPKCAQLPWARKALQARRAA